MIKKGLKSTVFTRMAKREEGQLMLMPERRFIKCPFKNEDPCNSECALYREELVVLRGEDVDDAEESLRAFCGNNGVMCVILGG